MNCYRESKSITNISVAGIVGAWCVVVNIRILITLIRLGLAVIGIILTIRNYELTVCAESTIQNGTRSVRQPLARSITFQLLGSGWTKKR